MPEETQTIAPHPGGRGLRFAQEMGIASPLDASLALALGASEVRPIEMANVYTTFAAGGRWAEPQLVDRVVGPDGEEVALPEPAPPRDVMSAAEAYVMTSMLRSVVTTGPARAARRLPFPVAGKTGTSQAFRDAWFIGYSPNIVVGVYVGYDTPKSLGYKQTGSSVAVPIFAKFSEKINMNNLKVPFRVPSGISFVRIDPKTGLPSNKENSILEPYILGTEPYSKNLNVIDTLNNFKNNSISGTGGLLQ